MHKHRERTPYPNDAYRVASATAGISEEILFRLFMLGLCGWLLTAILRRRETTQVILWTANVIAAVAFAAAHLPAVMVLLDVATPTDLPPVVLGELLVLNGIVGIVAGQQFMRHGLVAAIGIHFWADVVWHVIWPVISAM
jgi:membrane protease YdiL (CAAX protease family)